MISILGPYNTGIAVGLVGAATADIDTPIPVMGKLESVYVRYNIVPTAGGADVIVNGTFETDTDWTKGTNWSIPGTKKATAAAADANLTAAVAPLDGSSIYYVTYDLVVTTGSIRVISGAGVGVTRSVTGSYSELITSAATSFAFDPVTTFTGTVDNVHAYLYSSHADTDVIIATAGINMPAYTLLTVAASMTDGIKRPRVVPQGVTGVDLAALTIAEPWPVYDYINIKIDDSVPGDSIDVWLLVE
jgi:hypothetical protein